MTSFALTPSEHVLSVMTGFVVLSLRFESLCRMKGTHQSSLTLHTGGFPCAHSYNLSILHTDDQSCLYSFTAISVPEGFNGIVRMRLEILFH